MTSAGRTRDPEQRIRDIGQAAAELIAEAGPAALTHRAVAARAGVAVGTTTRYFSTIDDLRRHALEHLAAAVESDLDEIRRDLAGAPDPIAYLATAAAAGCLPVLVTWGYRERQALLDLPGALLADSPVELLSLLLS